MLKRIPGPYDHYRMPGEAFAITTETTGKLIMLRVQGDLDAGNAAGLRDVVTRALDASPVSIVLDLGGVGFIDSTGLGVIVGGDKRAQQLGSVIRLMNPRTGVRSTLALFGLDRLVDE
jgi:anti-sigma B factor antagonist